MSFRQPIPLQSAEAYPIRSDIPECVQRYDTQKLADRKKLQKDTDKNFTFLPDSKLGPVVVFKNSEERFGFGVSATSDIKPGAYVCAYLGEIKSGAIPLRGKLSQSVHPLMDEADSAYSFDYKIADKNEVISAVNQGSVGRYVNHNPSLTNIYISQDKDQLCFIAAKKIKAGQQLFCNYGDQFVFGDHIEYLSYYQNDMSRAHFLKQYKQFYQLDRMELLSPEFKKFFKVTLDVSHVLLPRSYYETCPKEEHPNLPVLLVNIKDGNIMLSEGQPNITTLMFACFKQDHERIKLLLQTEIDVFAETREGISAIRIADHVSATKQEFQKFEPLIDRMRKIELFYIDNPNKKRKSQIREKNKRNKDFFDNHIEKHVAKNKPVKFTVPKKRKKKSTKENGKRLKKDLPALAPLPHGLSETPSATTKPLEEKLKVSSTVPTEAKESAVSEDLKQIDVVLKDMLPKPALVTEIPLPLIPPPSGDLVTVPTIPSQVDGLLSIGQPPLMFDAPIFDLPMIDEKTGQVSGPFVPPTNYLVDADGWPIVPTENNLLFTRDMDPLMNFPLPGAMDAHSADFDLKVPPPVHWSFSDAENHLFFGAPTRTLAVKNTQPRGRKKIDLGEDYKDFCDMMQDPLFVGGAYKEHYQASLKVKSTRSLAMRGDQDLKKIYNFIKKLVTVSENDDNNFLLMQNLKTGFINETELAKRIKQKMMRRAFAILCASPLANIPNNLAILEKYKRTVNKTTAKRNVRYSETIQSKRSVMKAWPGLIKQKLAEGPDESKQSTTKIFNQLNSVPSLLALSEELLPSPMIVMPDKPFVPIVPDQEKVPLRLAQALK